MRLRLDSTDRRLPNRSEPTDDNVTEQHLKLSSVASLLFDRFSIVPIIKLAKFVESCFFKIAKISDE